MTTVGYLGTHQQPVAFSRQAFCGQEAAAKAFGTGIRNGLAFNQFEVFNDELGKPTFAAVGRALTLAEKLGVARITLADERRTPALRSCSGKVRFAGWRRKYVI